LKRGAEGDENERRRRPGGGDLGSLSLPSQLWDLGSIASSPSRVWGGVPTANAFLALSECHRTLLVKRKFINRTDMLKYCWKFWT